MNNRSAIALPPPDRAGAYPLARAIDRRRSERDYTVQEPRLAQIGQLLWAGQGSTCHGGRSVPSAGALHPLALMLVAGHVEALAPGVYRYAPGEHRLVPALHTDLRSALAAVAIEDQPWVRDCAAVIAIVGRAALCEARFGEQPPRGERARRYLYVEAGGVAQSVYLQAQALGLGTVLVGAFDDAEAARLLGLDPDDCVLGLMPVGTVADREK